jgi:hypothetical protein
MIRVVGERQLKVCQCTNPLLNMRRMAMGRVSSQKAKQTVIQPMLMNEGIVASTQFKFYPPVASTAA